jgi:prolyl oligopeptidase
VSLSRGGADAAVVREFDTRTKAFVPGGFTLPEAKSSVQWRTEDEIWVGTDFGEGSLTTSGYARLVKLWKRGTPLRQARTVFSCGAQDVGCFGFSQDTPEGRYDLVLRVPAFYRGERFLLLGGRLVKLPLPEDAELRQFFRTRR